MNPVRTEDNSNAECMYEYSTYVPNGLRDARRRRVIDGLVQWSEILDHSLPQFLPNVAALHFSMRCDKGSAGMPKQARYGRIFGTSQLARSCTSCCVVN